MEDLRPMIRGVLMFTTSASIIIVALRFLSRRLSKAGLWWDDWLCLGALPVVVALQIWVFTVTFHGLGQHFQDAPPDVISYMGTSIYANIVLYTVSLTLIKSSVLCSYQRLFRSVSRSFPIFIWIMHSLVIAWCIATLPVGIFQCTPVQAAWNLSLSRKCIDLGQFYLAQGIVDVILDVILLVTPVPFLLKLHITGPQKIGLTVVFALGYFVPIISILRLVAMQRISHPRGYYQPNLSLWPDYTWILVGAATWSTIEPAVGIISCSIPALKYLLAQGLKRAGISSAYRSTQSRGRPNKDLGIVSPKGTSSIRAKVLGLQDNLNGPSYGYSETLITASARTQGHGLSTHG